jgi:hypothetical protein
MKTKMVYADCSGGPVIEVVSISDQLLKRLLEQTVYWQG